MTTTTAAPETFAELLERLGNVPAARIRLQPPPGTATVEDVIRLNDTKPKRLCELVDGVLVEKAMGHRESRLAAWLVHFLTSFLEQHDIGIVAGADGPHRLSADLVRLPDVSFIAYDRIPDGADPNTPTPDWIPNLAVEIVSPGNTSEEMRRKLGEYFQAGVAMVWLVNPDTRTVRVHLAEDQFTELSEADELDGGSVLPGFRVPVQYWFEKALKVRK